MANENDKGTEDNFDFIKEKIKTRPINKKKVLMKTGSTFLFAVLFGAVASCTFVMLKPWMEQQQSEREKPAKITIPKDEDHDVADVQLPEIPEEKPPVVIKEEVAFEIADYKELYNKFALLINTVDKSMVTITTVSNSVGPFNNTYENKEGQAAGVIVGNNGQELLILTERALIADADHMKVTFSDRTVVDAAIKKYDGNTGVTIVSVPISNLSEQTLENNIVLELGNSNTVRKGDPVIAIGSPLGYNDSVIYGNITSVSNKVNTADANYRLLNTNILGNENGSGIVVDLDGKVVGLIAQKFSNDKSSVACLAISDIKSIIEKLSNNQHIAYLGIEAADVTKEIEAERGLPKGIYITRVAMDSPAMSAAIQNGDIVVKMGDKDVRSVEECQGELLGYNPGDVIQITVKRQGKDGYVDIKFLVTLGVLD